MIERAWLLWGSDVHNFAEVERRLETQNMFWRVWLFGERQLKNI
jgi:hypothetical protein